MFYVGQRVMCVDGVWGETLPGENAPVTGGHYTVREIVPPDEFCVYWSLTVVEIRNNPQDFASGYVEPSYDVDQFCALTDISQFQSMLTHQPLFKPAKEDV